MTLLSALARMEAAAAGRAQPAATVLHRHLSRRPLVLVPLTTAGEAGAPLGALVGDDREAPLLLVVAQPRDRDLRFAFLSRLADAVLPHLESAQEDVEFEERKETDPETGKRVTVEAELCADAPQLLVPNEGGVEFLRLLGRSTRFRRTAEEDPESPYPAPPRVPLLGRWLTHYGERARVPGQSLLLSMTELLSRHWATGQSALEDRHLGALLAWIDPPPPGTGRGTVGDAGADGGGGTVRGTGAEAALRAEVGRDAAGQLLLPPAGPATDPAFDNRLLAPAVARFDAGVPGAEEEIGKLLESQLRPTWDAVWHGLDLLRTLPVGERVTERWKRDRWSYTGHRDRLRTGEPPQPRRDDAVTAAAKLAVREQAQARLEAQEALDDPLAMAERRLAGTAFAGEVVAVEMAWSEGKRPMPRPLVTMRTEDSPQLAEGGKVHRALAEGAKQSAELAARPGTAEDPDGPAAPDGPADTDGTAEPGDPGAGPAGSGLFTLRLTGGMGRGKEPAPGSVPQVGDRLCWTLFEHAPRGGPGLPAPEDTPWTHGGPPPGAGEDPARRPVPPPDPVTSEDLV